MANLDLEEAYSELQILNAEIKAIGKRKHHLSRVIFNVNKLITDAINDAASKRRHYEIQWMTEKKQMLSANRVLLSDAGIMLKLLVSQKNELLSKIQVEENRIIRKESNKEKRENTKKLETVITNAAQKRQELKNENIRRSEEKNESEFRILRNLLKEKFGLEWFVALMDEVRDIKAKLDAQASA